jgi:FlaA1/EpsC-like NDP-sugar epimerase
MGLSIVKLISFSGVFLAIILLAERVLYKYVFEFFYKKLVSKEEELIPTLIVGAGFMGKSVYREIVESEPREFSPVCFVDDNLGLVGEEVCGIPVFGPTVFIPELCKKYHIGMIIFAIPSCEPNARKRILESCKGLNCQVRVIPSLEELTRVETGYLKQLVNVDVEKLLGRDAIRIKNDKVEKFIKNKVCLVTGGGGSIGSELCRQIIKMNPKKLVILDIYENNAYEIQQELKRDGFDDSVVFVEIASVRDRKKMDYLFSKYKFDIVFHASAHKHVPLMETNPEEAIKNNVMGTYNIAHMCHKYSAHKMVLISTDKAVNPTNVMGASKRLCEMVMQYMSQRHKKTKYTAVRFGNVLGSNGSVIPLFTKQIEAGGPVTVTHPDIIRYFMTIPEAVSLVLEAGTMSNGGEIFVLDMGKPVKIVTLAENLIKMYGYKPYEDIDIEFCGLRAGEKLFEELLMSDENLKETYNKRIYINDQIEVDCNMFWEQLKQLFDVAAQNNSEKTVELMHEFVPTFKKPEEINFKKELITK